MALQVWKELFHHGRMEKFFASTNQELLEQEKVWMKREEDQLMKIFSSGWDIWKYQNNLVFNGDGSPLRMLIQQINKLINYVKKYNKWRRGTKNKYICKGKGAWEAPPTHHLKMNMEDTEMKENASSEMVLVDE